MLAILPYPMCIDGSYSSGSRSGNMSEHCERDIEVVVGMGSPGQAPLTAKLRHANGALHCPEMRIGQRYINGMQFRFEPELPPIRRDHVCGGWQARCATELRHDLPAGITLLGATGIFCIGKDALLAGTEPCCFFERPGSVGVERDSSLRETFCKCGNSFHLLRATEHSTF